MGGKQTISNDKSSIKSSYILRICQTSLDYHLQPRAFAAIRALCEAKIRVKFFMHCSSCDQLTDTNRTYKFYSCQHYICLACLSNIITLPKNLNNPNIEPEKLTCKHCSQGQAELSDILKFRNEHAPQSLKNTIQQYITIRGVNCPVCCVHIYNSDLLFTARQCGHSFCKDCMSMYIENEVNQSITDIKNPCHCDYYLSQGEVKELINNQLYQNYLRFSARSIGFKDGENQKNDEIFIFCMNKDCGDNNNGLMGFSILKTSKLKSVNCPHCMTRHCINCKKIAEDDHDCQNSSSGNGSGKQTQVKVKKKDDEDDDFIQKMIEQGQMQKCPNCGMPCILDRGCFYVTCNSAQCRRKTHFCFICAKVLRTSNLHFDHYPEGPFVKKCNTTENKLDPQGD